MAIVEGEVTVYPVKATNVAKVLEQPKSYELDWSKVTTFTDVVLLLKLITGAKDQRVFIYLTDEQAETYSHLFKAKDESNL